MPGWVGVPSIYGGNACEIQRREESLRTRISDLQLRNGGTLEEEALGHSSSEEMCVRGREAHQVEMSLLQSPLHPIHSISNTAWQEPQGSKAQGLLKNNLGSRLHHCCTLLLTHTSPHTCCSHTPRLTPCCSHLIPCCSHTSRLTPATHIPQLTPAAHTHLNSHLLLTYLTSHLLLTHTSL